ncbi:MAG: hypothetical protein LBQ80_04115 [Clostridium sp.]|jgi:hypothetical protein|nr:hypothetical protein [Clostridium sp.]
MAKSMGGYNVRLQTHCLQAADGWDDRACIACKLYPCSRVCERCKSQHCEDCYFLFQGSH